MVNIPDHPEIARCQDTGHPYPVKFPRCPECNAETDTFYKRDGEVIGCDNCIKSVNAWEETDEEAVELLGFEVLA